MPIGDSPNLSSYLYNKHLFYFGELFRRICAIANLSQDKLADLSKQEYGRLIEVGKLNPGANIGALSKSAISRAQLGEFRPTPQQIFFWIETLKERLEELDLELDPQIRKACYTLALGGPLEEVEQAIDLVKAIERMQQSTIAKPASNQKDTDFDLSSLPDLRHLKNMPHSDMTAEDVEKACAAIQKQQEQKS